MKKPMENTNSFKLRPFSGRHGDQEVFSSFEFTTEAAHKDESLTSAIKRE